MTGTVAIVVITDTPTDVRGRPSRWRYRPDESRRDPIFDSPQYLDFFFFIPKDFHVFIWTLTRNTLLLLFPTVFENKKHRLVRSLVGLIRPTTKNIPTVHIEQRFVMVDSGDQQSSNILVTVHHFTTTTVTRHSFFSVTTLFVSTPKMHCFGGISHSRIDTFFSSF